jgi:mRNA interferase RelE/StbE
MWRVVILPEVKKRLARLPADDRERILRALLALSAGPSAGDVKPLRGRPEWRLRVGGWRVLLRIVPEDQAIFAVHLGPRGDVYK